MTTPPFCIPIWSVHEDHLQHGEGWSRQYWEEYHGHQSNTISRTGQAYLISLHSARLGSKPFCPHDTYETIVIPVVGIIMTLNLVASLTIQAFMYNMQGHRPENGIRGMYKITWLNQNHGFKPPNLTRVNSFHNRLRRIVPSRGELTELPSLLV